MTVKEERDRSHRVVAGVADNARITGMLGGVLLVLLAIEGFTILAIRSMLSVHLFVGILMLPVVLAKFGSTGYRFIRYYSGDRAYRAAGPPPVILRLDGPLVILSTVAVLTTGLELWLFGFRYGAQWLTWHQLAFVAWFGFMSIHVLGHLARAPQLILEEFRQRLDGSAITRRSLVLSAILTGLALALATSSFATPFLLPFRQ